MYPSGTILRLREPQSTEDAPYPYDLVEVVGQSPIQHVTQGGDGPWAGQDAFGWIIKPAGEGFAPTIDKPLGEINELYEVESYPEDETGEPLKPKNTPQGLPSPEQVFAQEARNQEVQKRERAAAFQHDGKSPEQVLREASAKEKKKNDGKA